MDENSSNQNPQQTDQSSTAPTQQDQTANPVQNQTDNPITSQPVNDQTQTANPSNTDTQPKTENYIEEVGGDMIGLLDEINEDVTLIQKVADEMQFDKEKVKTMLTSLLNKIDQGQITEDDIALIMASTVADDLTDQNPDQQ